MTTPFDLHRELGLDQARRELNKLRQKIHAQEASNLRAGKMAGYRVRIGRIGRYLAAGAERLSEVRRLALEIQRLRLQMEVGAVAEGTTEREITRLYRQARAARRAARG